MINAIIETMKQVFTKPNTEALTLALFLTHKEDEELDQDEEDGVSWKVRKAAAKCLSAIVTTRPDARRHGPTYKTPDSY